MNWRFDALSADANGAHVERGVLPGFSDWE